ncbi:hypothetical protein QWZ04_16695 [Vibrio tapetis subsp. quintayensis]|uniref:hypothetical protein n=1 Tax=Vibrio tapetis TaxID=52443 RepID=UPI0025B39DB7|nr:hypothetical protein [Vibrio tapetis]MDN3681947.1 hypothetical protein [Vibrio tapetis subsp. quintayensis]
MSNNAKMIALGIGKAGMRASAKAGVFITVVYSVVFRTLELALTKNYSVTNWIVHVGSDVVKAALAAFFGCFVGSFALTSGVVLFPIGLGIFVAFVSGLILETLEGRYLNKERIIKSINHKIEETISGDISKINRDVETQRAVSQMTPILVGGL